MQLRLFTCTKKNIYLPTCNHKCIKDFQEEVEHHSQFLVCVCVYVCVIILICNTTEVVVGFLAFANTNSGRICNVTPY